MANTSIKVNLEEQVVSYLAHLPAICSESHRGTVQSPMMMSFDIQLYRAEYYDEADLHFLQQTERRSGLNLFKALCAMILLHFLVFIGFGVPIRLISRSAARDAEKRTNLILF